MSAIQVIIYVSGGLGLFLFGMKIMSESLQVATGDRLRIILSKVTNNRILGLLTGFVITSIIQSSSATTVMLVSFVNAGLLNLQQSIGIILGANIGTTVTGWLVAIFGFKVKISAFALPAIAIGFFLRFLKNDRISQWGEVLLGFGILFLGLDTMNSAFKDLRGSAEVMDFMALHRAYNLPSTLIVVVIGSLVTMLIQSSSATMAMTMTLAVNGLIDFPTSCALILGENIGTTITANIASLGASVPAKQCARAHTIFNAIGVLWIMTILHHFFVPFIDWLIPGDPYSTDIAVRSEVIADHMAAFHSFFNITNAILFLPFVNFLAKVASKLVFKQPEENGQKEREYHLKYMSHPVITTPSITIREARIEAWRMSGIVLEMFEMVMTLLQKPDEKLGEIVEKIQKSEETVDTLEEEISEFLVSISKHNISRRHNYEISRLLHIINELERIGDHCVSLMKLTRRKYDTKLVFSKKADAEIAEISKKVRDFLQLIYDKITTPKVNIIPRSNMLENRINELVDEFMKKHEARLHEAQCDIVPGFLYVDMLNRFEKIGDHAYNIAEGISGKRIF